MRKVLLSAFLFVSFFSPFILAAQRESASLLVRVADPQGAALVGATVTLHRRDDRVRVTAVTDAAGAYRFQGLGAGLYLVEVQAPGFAIAPAQPVRLRETASEEMAFTLELAAYQEQVVVTASGTVQTVDEVSKALTVVEAQEIEARDEYALAEALRTVPGLRVQQLGGPGNFTSIKTRGLRNEDTALLIDGVRFRDAASTQGDASGFMEALVVTDLDRVEILRGSGSSLYGSNAVGGVINIVTREGGGHSRGSLFLEGGSLELLRARAQTSGGLRKDDITYSAGISRLRVSKGVDGDDGADNTSVQGRLRLRLSPTASLSARIYAADASVKLNESPEAVGSLPATGILAARPLSSAELARYESGTPVSRLSLGDANFIPSANDPDSERESSFVSAVVSFEQRPSETFGYTVRYHGVTTERSFLDGPLGVSAFEPTEKVRSDFDGRIHTLHGRMDAEWGPYNFISAGYQLESETFVSRSFPEDPADNSSVDVTQRSHAFFIQDQLRLKGGALQLSGAFRAQFFSLDSPELTPAESAPYQGVDFEAPATAYTGDGSVAYFFRHSGTKLRAHLGNGYRAPSLFERFGTFFGSFGYLVFGDPRLRPERSVAFDAGVDQDLAGDRLRASGTFFYTRLQKVIVFDFSGAINPATDPFGRFGGYRRVEGGTARGLELAVTAAPAPGLHVAVAYTYTDAEPPTGQSEDLAQAFVIPKNQFSLVATQRLGRDLSVTFDLTVSDDYLAPVFDAGTFTSRSYRFDGIAKADLGVQYWLPLSKRRVLRIFAKVDNLFDDTYFESGFRTPGQTALGGVALEF
ncbi:MAG: TonB-dependent receptor domain-containing protein [Acidobacteriota bacterium]